MSKALIECMDLVKEYDGSYVVDHISFDVKPKEFLTILGPSGCGKTTTLRMIGGFETPTKGDILLNGKSLIALPPYERPINTVFQRYALFPHMSIYENIAFGLHIKKFDKAEIDRRVSKMLKLVNLEGYEKRRVNSLSGGQQQRIAIARALVNEPQILLLDEPLGALDLKLRKEMQLELKYMQQDLGITFIYVTHDQEEALTMSDKIIIMNKGKIQQVGSPIDIYNEPENAFVADFIGESNIVSGVFQGSRAVEFANKLFPCIDEEFSKGEAVDVVIRPEDIVITNEDKAQLFGEVDSIVFKGVHYEMIVLENEREWLIQSTIPHVEGEKVGLYIAPDLIHIMKKEEE